MPVPQPITDAINAVQADADAVSAASTAATAAQDNLAAAPR